jgi:hypothetical protein
MVSRLGPTERALLRTTHPFVIACVYVGSFRQRVTVRASCIAVTGSLAAVPTGGFCSGIGKNDGGQTDEICQRSTDHRLFPHDAGCSGDLSGLEVASCPYSASGKGRGRLFMQVGDITPTLCSFTGGRDAHHPDMKPPSLSLINPGRAFSSSGERVKRPMMTASGDPRRGFAFCTLPLTLGWPSSQSSCSTSACVHFYEEGGSYPLWRRKVSFPPVIVLLLLLTGCSCRNPTNWLRCNTISSHTGLLMLASDWNFAPASCRKSEADFAPSRLVHF